MVSRAQKKASRALQLARDEEARGRAGAVLKLSKTSTVVQGLLSPTERVALERSERADFERQQKKERAKEIKLEVEQARRRQAIGPGRTTPGRERADEREFRRRPTRLVTRVTERGPTTFRVTPARIGGVRGEVVESLSTKIARQEEKGFVTRRIEQRLAFASAPRKIEVPTLRPRTFDVKTKKEVFEPAPKTGPVRRRQQITPQTLFFGEKGAVVPAGPTFFKVSKAKGVTESIKRQRELEKKEAPRRQATFDVIEKGIELPFKAISKIKKTPIIRHLPIVKRAEFTTAFAAGPVVTARPFVFGERTVKQVKEFLQFAKKEPKAAGKAVLKSAKLEFKKKGATRFIGELAGEGVVTSKGIGVGVKVIKKAVPFSLRAEKLTIPTKTGTRTIRTLGIERAPRAVPLVTISQEGLQFGKPIFMEPIKLRKLAKEVPIPETATGAKVISQALVLTPQESARISSAGQLVKGLRGEKGLSVKEVAL